MRIRRAVPGDSGAGVDPIDLKRELAVDPIREDHPDLRRLIGIERFRRDEVVEDGLHASEWYNDHFPVTTDGDRVVVRDTGRGIIVGEEFVGLTVGADSVEFRRAGQRAVDQAADRRKSAAEVTIGSTEAVE